LQGRAGELPLRKEAESMKKEYEAIVTYRVRATDETDATGQVLNNMLAPETVDVYALPTRQKVEVDLIPF